MALQQLLLVLLLLAPSQHDVRMMLGAGPLAASASTFHTMHGSGSHTASGPGSGSGSHTASGSGSASLAVVGSAGPSSSACNLTEARQYWYDGRLAGVWRISQEPGARFVPLGDGGCTVNLLKQPMPTGLGIMYLGDSNDHYVKTPYCWFVGHDSARGEPHPARNGSFMAGDHYFHPHDHHGLNYCFPSTGLTLGHYYLPGVHPYGPYHFNLQGDYVQRTHMALETWHSKLGMARPPDLVVLSSSVWDIAGGVMRGDVQLFEPEMPMHWLNSYMKNLTDMIGYMRSMFPTETVVAFRTSPIPRFEPTTLHMRVVPGHVAHINKLNAAGMAVAKKLHVPILDYAAVAAEFQAPVHYLVDDLHLKQDVSLEVMNLQLNLLATLGRPDIRPGTGGGGGGSA